MKAGPSLFRHLLFPVVLLYFGSMIAANRHGSTRNSGRIIGGTLAEIYKYPSVRHRSTRNSGRIIGGKVAESSKYPFVVSIQAHFNNAWTHHCGGSIISRRAILTACHCVVRGAHWDPPQLVDPRGFRVVAGVSDLKNASLLKQVSNIERVEAHPKCGNKPYYLSYDVGTYILKSPLVYTATVQPLKVISRNPLVAIKEFSSLARNGASCYSPGWGTTKSPGYYPSMVLKVAKLQLFTTKQCQRFFCQRINDYCDLDYYDAKQVCAAGDDSSDCNGDSGGPLVCRGRVFATVSWRIRCEFGWPHVFTNIIPILDVVNKYADRESGRSAKPESKRRLWYTPSMWHRRIG